jgi:hypothetical protein
MAEDEQRQEEADRQGVAPEESDERPAAVRVEVQDDTNALEAGV